MVNVGKREDGLLDWANDKAERVKLALLQIDLFEKKALTESEIGMLNTLKGILRK